MSQIIYNTITLSRLNLLAYERTPIFNGVDYLFTRHVLRVRGIYNPNATSYARINAVPVVGIPASVVGSKAPDTDLALRHFLSQPRQPLRYTVGNVDVLTVGFTAATAGAAGDLRPIDPTASPFPIDVNNGPFPKVNDIVRVSGTKTYLVDFSVQVDVNECYLYSNTPSIMLSHRYMRIHEIDQDGYTQTVQRGRAIFRADKLLTLGTVPDDYRAYLMPNLAVGHKRVVCKVWVTEDPNVLDYEVIDRELAYTITQIGITRIEAFMTVGTVRLSVEGVALGIFSALLQKQKVGKFIEGGLSSLPLTEIVIVARVWGNNTTPADNIQDVAVGICRTRMDMAFQGNPFAQFTANTEFALTRDLAGSYTEAKARKITAFSQGAISGIVNGANLPDLTVYFPRGKDDTAPWLVYGADAPTAMGLPNQPNPTTNIGSRGTYIGRLFGAALLGQCGVPPPATRFTGAGKQLTPP